MRRLIIIAISIVMALFPTSRMRNQYFAELTITTVVWDDSVFCSGEIEEGGVICRVSAGDRVKLKGVVDGTLKVTFDSISDEEICITTNKPMCVNTSSKTTHVEFVIKRGTRLKLVTPTSVSGDGFYFDYE